MHNGTPREVAFLVCLSEAYELAGKKMADSTILSAAKEMASRIPCPDNEIKELFVTAREIDNIPTIKTLWKAWNVINDNRVVTPSNAIAYDSNSALMRKLNIQKTMDLLCWHIGKYAQLCTAYCTQKVGKDKYEYKNPGLKHQFDSEIFPMLEQICGEHLGENPNHPNHPIQVFIRSRNAGRRV